MTIYIPQDNNKLTQWRKNIQQKMTSKTPIKQNKNKDFDLVFIKTPSKSPGNERYPKRSIPSDQGFGNMIL